MLEGFVPFPPEFVQRYRDKGYWQGQTLAKEFDAVFRRFADRVALIDGDRQFTYAELDRVTTNLALNLLEIGLRPLDRVVPTLPNWRLTKAAMTSPVSDVICSPLPAPSAAGAAPASPSKRRPRGDR